MTPQERKLIDELFDRLASLENNPRDPEAVRAINEGLQRAPNALYPLVQTALVQDEALKRADARIRELEDELGVEPGEPVKQAGFLDNMRDALLGKPQGSVPSVRPGAPPAASPWRNTSAQPGRLCRRAAGAGLWRPAWLWRRHRPPDRPAARFSAPRPRPPRAWSAARC